MASHICNFCRRMVPDLVALIKVHVLSDTKVRTTYYHPSCFQERQRVPPVDRSRKVVIMPPAEAHPKATYRLIACAVLFIGIIMVLANAMRERPVYADEPMPAPMVAVVPLVEPTPFPVALPIPVTVVERIVERVVYVPINAPKVRPTKHHASVDRGTSCTWSTECSGGHGCWRGKCVGTLDSPTDVPLKRANRSSW